MRKTRELTKEGREFLQSEFSSMGLEFVPSAANFVLLRVGDGDQVFQALLRRGIIVRAMRSYKLPEWLRVLSEPWIKTGASSPSCGAWIPRGLWNTARPTTASA